ncbi:EAL domain-containing protein [Litoribrevibacter euphylliae]|uniref:EAL domain-containing protein n=1 Tax=Litoribrevibacter euphylliae TaxID=1834034 RepID=A0ABV7H8E7_9GAMM
MTSTVPQEPSVQEYKVQSLLPYYSQVDNFSIVINLSDYSVISIACSEQSLQKCLSSFVHASLFELIPELKNYQQDLSNNLKEQTFYTVLETTTCHLVVNANTIVTDEVKEPQALLHISVPEPKTDCSFIYLLSRALEAAHHGIIISDARLPDQPVIYCNQAFTILSGYETHEILGKNCRFLQGTDRDQRGADIVRQSIAEGKECQTVLRNYKKNGEMFWNELTISPVFDGHGDVTHYIGIQYNITDQMLVEGALKESEKRYRTLFETNVDGIAYYDLEGNCIDANETYCHMLGKRWEDVVESTSENITPKHWHTIDRRIRESQLKNALHCQEYEKELIRNDTEVFPVNVRQCLHLNEHGQPIAFWLLIRDISRQKETLEKLEHSRQLLNETGKLAKVGGWEMLEDQSIYLTQEAVAILGFHSDRTHLTDLSSLFIDEQKLLFRKSVEITYETEEPLDITLQTTHSDTPQFLRVQGHIKVDEGSRTIVGAVQDITETKVTQDKLIEHESHLKYLAHHDALTGLPNRLLYNDRVTHAIMRAKRENHKVAVLLLDLDRFKVINDSLGHDIGDRFLKSIASRASLAIRESDTFARLGGDEFVVLLEGIHDTQDVVTVTQKLQTAISLPIQVENHNLHSSASIGIAMYPEDGKHVDELLRCADAAMYRVKDQGKNNFQFYTKEINHRAVELLVLENDMHKAIEEKEFLLHYQPQISLENNAIIGLESLVRWHHPEKGMISPGDFIPLAEESGMIMELGEWVLMESCRQAREWLDIGYDFGKIAVNLSAKQFHRSNIVAQVKEALKTYNLPPDNLELEITESIAIENIDITIETLKELKALGIHLAIDDFGTGYSSLSYLKRFSIDKLKIDKSFVDDILTDDGGAAIATSTIALAHQMGLKVIAEGVETQDQCTFLKEHDCDEAQGYHISRPLSSKDAQKFFDSYSHSS